MDTWYATKEIMLQIEKIRAGKPHCESIELFELGVICE